VAFIDSDRVFAVVVPLQVFLGDPGTFEELWVDGRTDMGTSRCDDVASPCIITAVRK
jgi:hypothetical protein